MWIVKLALRRPYTFVVMAVLIFILGTFSALRMPTDILPEIDIPVIAVVWNFTGISPDDMERRIVSNSERGIFTTVNDIEHIESQSLAGVAVIKVFFHPGAKIEAATAQITAISQTNVKQMPAGSTPPLIIRYSASNVPILQISTSSPTLPEEKLFDLSVNSLRTSMVSVPGLMMPYPYGGKQRQIVVDLDPDKLYAWNLAPSDVSSAIGSQNLILPAGTTKIGVQEYNVRLNSSPAHAADLNDLPIKTVDGKTVFVRDVAHVRDGFSPQTNMVHVNGKRGVIISVLKNGGSTLDIVKNVRERLPAVQATLPPDLKVELLSDQSVFVRAAVEGVVKEAAIAAFLTALMILLFLGSWRSTLIVIVSIPLSILVAIIILYLMGQSLNVMTLGGMALAVGILVDDATVEIENIHRNLGQRKPLVTAILDGAQQIAVPAFVSTLCICIVFVPVAFITGAARSLFVPLSMSVVFAMLTSYMLSRTLVPTMVQALLAAEVEVYAEGEDGGHAGGSGLIWGVHHQFNRVFTFFRRRYGGYLAWSLDHRLFVAVVFAIFVGGSFMLVPMIGQDFFPGVDAGLIRMHVRGPAGTRIEETERIFAKVEDAIRAKLPPHEIKTIIDIIGIPYSGLNLSLSDGTLISSADGEILITLEERHGPTADHVRRLRAELGREFPGLTIFFQPADITTQVLNFGLPAPIDIQLVGPRGALDENFKLAREIRRRIARIPGLVDAHIAQVTTTPELAVDVDRTRASEQGLSQRDVANDLLISLSSSGQASPNFWLDPRNGVQYSVAVQTPQRRIDSFGRLTNTPITPPGTNYPQTLGNLAKVSPAMGTANVLHHDSVPTVNVQASVQDTDLGSVAAAVDRVLDEIRPQLPRGTVVNLRGQVQSMRSSFRGLGYGLFFAVLLVYLLMVVNFQSWLDPFIILMALPGALAGICWMLFCTGTTMSVPALMGAIMCIGVATANSILMVTFANDLRADGRDARQAALIAGVTRLRPVVMTALAMIIGMLPMALGFGEGGEQNSPLGRAVIGGLSAATFATLIFVPVVYSVLRRRAPVVMSDE